MRKVQFLVALVALAVIVAGCQTFTGRQTSQWWEDKATTAKVKTALAAEKVGTTTRVDVDTFDGTVYLTGTVDDPRTKEQLEQMARQAADGKPVFSNLTVGTAARTAAASPRTEPGSGTMVAARTPVVAGLRFDRVEPEAVSGGGQRFAAFDRSGKRVATVYTIDASRLRQAGVTDLDGGERRVDHVSLYPHAGSDGMQYHVVLWHIDRSEARTLQ
jgi:hypothetical protein